jgi:hypothetical protein
MSEERVRDILSRLEFPTAPSAELEEVKEKESDSIWLERNIERYPIYFTGSEKAKQEIEKKIIESKEPFVITKRQTDNGYKLLALSPAAAYGLIDGDDAKVVTGIFSYLQEEIKPKLGYYPKKFFITLKEICERLYIEKSGQNYKFIIRALRTISGCAILQTDFFETRTRRGEKNRTLSEKELRIFHSVKITKKDRLTNQGLKNKEYSVEIELENWIIQNLENYYATKIDKEIFFKKLDSQRSRRLYNFLTIHNYQKEKEIDTQEIIELLWIMDEDTDKRKRSIIRAIEPLIEAGFLEDYEFSWEKIIFVFVKVRQRSISIRPEDKAKIDGITLKILEELGDRQSERFYKLIAKRVPEHIIFLCLSEIKEMGRHGQIKHSKGAVFVEMIARECKKRGIKVPFRQRNSGVSLL